MEKVLLVGKFTDHFREINKKLATKYEVRACVNKLEIFRGMFKLNKPDVVVMIFGEMNETNESLLREVQKEHSEIPVVCAGINTEGEKRLANLMLTNVAFLPPPYSTKEVEEKVESVLNENFVEGMLLKTLGIDLSIDDEYKQVEPKEETKKEIKKEEVKKPEQKAVRTEAGKGKKSILLVDDSGIYLRMLNGLLAEEYDVRMTTSGLKALSLIRESRPDLILLDYEMPIFDGRETMIKIREVEENKDIPIIFVTAVNQKDHIKAVLELNPAGYILKPVNKEKLFEKIRSVIGV